MVIIYKELNIFSFLFVNHSLKIKLGKCKPNIWLWMLQSPVNYTLFVIIEMYLKTTVKLTIYMEQEDFMSINSFWCISRASCHWGPLILYTWPWFFLSRAHVLYTLEMTTFVIEFYFTQLTFFINFSLILRQHSTMIKRMSISGF